MLTIENGSNIMLMFDSNGRRSNGLPPVARFGLADIAILLASFPISPKNT
jgi:hypothetical protein